MVVAGDGFWRVGAEEVRAAHGTVLRVDAETRGARSQAAPG